MKTQFLEILDQPGYDFWFSIDQYLYRGDSARAISESIRWLPRCEKILQGWTAEIDTLTAPGDVVQTSCFLCKAFLDR